MLGFSTFNQNYNTTTDGSFTFKEDTIVKVKFSSEQKMLTMTIESSTTTATLESGVNYIPCHILYGAGNYIELSDDI